MQFLSEPEVFLAAVNDQHRGLEGRTEDITASIASLEKRLTRIGDAEARAYSGYAREMASEDAYYRVCKELGSDRVWIEDELKLQRQALEDTKHSALGADAIRRLHPKLVERLSNPEFEDKRFVLESMDTVVTVSASGVELSLAVPENELSSVSDAVRAGGRVSVTQPEEPQGIPNSSLRSRMTAR